MCSGRGSSRKAPTISEVSQRSLGIEPLPAGWCLGDPGVQMGSAEDAAGCLTFFCELVSRGLSGVGLVISDVHRGLIATIGATLPGSAAQPIRPILGLCPCWAGIFCAVGGSGGRGRLHQGASSQSMRRSGGWYLPGGRWVGRVRASAFSFSSKLG